MKKSKLTLIITSLFFLLFLAPRFINQARAFTVVDCYENNKLVCSVTKVYKNDGTIEKTTIKGEKIKETIY